MNFLNNLFVLFNKTILYYFSYFKDAAIASFQSIFCTKTKSLSRNCQNKSPPKCLFISGSLLSQFFFRYPIHRCCRLVQRQSLAKINPKKNLFLSTTAKSFFASRIFFVKQHPPKKHYYYIHTTRINKQLRKQQNKDGKKEGKTEDLSFSPSSLIQLNFFYCTVR